MKIEAKKRLIAGMPARRPSTQEVEAALEAADRLLAAPCHGDTSSPVQPTLDEQLEGEPEET